MYLASTKTWYLERTIFLLAGLFSLAGISIGYLVSPFGYLLNLLVGINLVVFATTGFCVMSVILNKLGFAAKCNRE
ncbi:DUF2892 domain-containing protein [Leptospira ognonensis]|uniref:DUF2892 domain-containing protein n=1 Tax=Leptospira ognonensis TaxID=2484945 RepID=A0A4R9JZC5_9LEPT|nr:YgaP-like transmembrane domain [Leptospira ognonensis]TGL57079.1 DUF2892 domain-containing protein [Leptospira ognonensis]